MKILVSADWHIVLHKKRVPVQWQANRFREFFSKLYNLEKTHDIHIIAGDLFDRKPENDEVCLLLEFLNNVSIPTYIIPGNHEATKKGQTFLENFVEFNAVSNPNINIYTKNTRTLIAGQGFQFYPYGEMQLDNLPDYVPGDILVTHIRGCVPPHITAEYDFEKIRPWKLILLGDLHFAHRYQDFPAYYPGSPLNVNFDRDEAKDYGVYSLDFTSIDKFRINFIDLELPRLLRKTISVGEPMEKDPINHVIYEVVGSLDKLSDVENSELLDKKIVDKPAENSKLDLRGKTLRQELELWLDYAKIDGVDEVLKEFDNLGFSQ